jgi:hypothetical protein
MSAVPVIIGGADRVGAASGVTGVEGADAVLGPSELLAVTVNVYEVPSCSPVTVIGLPLPCADSLPGEAVTVYPSIPDVPWFTGAVKLTEACPSEALAVTLVGGSGTVASAAFAPKVHSASITVTLAAPPAATTPPHASHGSKARTRWAGLIFYRHAGTANPEAADIGRAPAAGRIGVRMLPGKNVT